MNLLLILAGGSVGALTRYVVDHLIHTRIDRSLFPAGTLFINLTGAFTLGIITGSAMHHGLSNNWRLLLGVGFCGAYTTFSTFSFETVRLYQDGTWRQGSTNVLATVGGGCLLAAIGMWLAAA